MTTSYDELAAQHAERKDVEFIHAIEVVVGFMLPPDDHRKLLEIRDCIEDGESIHFRLGNGQDYYARAMARF